MIHVPDEIWRQIFTFFECILPDDKWWWYGAQVDRSPLKDLLSIAHVCKHFHGLARPLIYRTIVLEGLDGDVELEFERRAQRLREMPTHEEQRRRSIEEILQSAIYNNAQNIRHDRVTRAMIACPSLGQHTRVINIDDTGLPSAPGLDKMIHEILPSLSLPGALRKQMEIKLKQASGYKAVGLAVLLALTPNARLVDISYHGTTEALIWMLSGRPDIINQLTSDAHVLSDTREENVPSVTNVSFSNYGLSNLEEVRIRTGNRRYFVTPIHSVEALLLHPNLRTLRLFGINWLQPSLDLLRWTKEPCGIHLLDLRECVVEASSVRYILSRFTSLHTLLVHLDGGRYLGILGETEWDIQLDEFGSVLRELGQGLNNLCLDTNLSCPGRQCRGHLGSLREMRSLKHLKVAYSNLINMSESIDDVPKMADVLPHSLETIHLLCESQHHDDKHYKERCRHISQVVTEMLENGQMPYLRRVTVEQSCAIMEGEFAGPIRRWDMTIESEYTWEFYNGVPSKQNSFIFSRSTPIQEERAPKATPLIRQNKTRDENV